MATELKFPFEPWDGRNDQRALRASTSRAFGLVENDIDFYSDQDSQEKQAHYVPVIREVIALLAECVDYLRWEGIDPAFIQGQVLAVRRENVETKERRQELKLQKTEALLSPDPDRKGEKLSESKKPREVR